MKTNYSHPAVQSLAFDLFELSQDSYSLEELDNLKEALNNLYDYTPSNRLKQCWQLQFGHVEFAPQQLVRDQQIVDYLVMEKNMTLDRATKLWSAWEDEEYELLQQPVQPEE